MMRVNIFVEVQNEETFVRITLQSFSATKYIC